MKEEMIRTLEQYNQKHIIEAYQKATKEQQEYLDKQLETVDFSVLDLCKKGETTKEKGTLSPIEAITISEIEAKKAFFYQNGLEAIRQHKVGAVLLAGGQGTRLGLDKPKGTFNIGKTRDLYIFQCLIQNLLDVVKQADSWVPLMVMTSEINHEDTVAFFKEHDYFGYNCEFIFFFQQEMAPSVDYDGKLLMENPGKLVMSANGNGGWFSSLIKSKVLDKVKAMGVQWLNVFAVDNVLQKIADPFFIGATLETGYDCGAKVVAKAAPDEKVGVLCLEDGKPSIVEYYELTEELLNARTEDGNLMYNYGVILNYLFRISSLERIMNENMPLHIVEKKIPHMDCNGNYVKPEQPNGYKFETLVLDMIHMLDNCLAYEVVRKKEFAPVKNKEGVDSVESARLLLEENGIAL